MKITIKKLLLSILVIIILIFIYLHWHHTTKKAVQPLAITSTTNIVIFGDSLSDMGNAADAPYTSSGGKVWAEYLAAALNTTLAPSNQGGDDWAIAGNETDGVITQVNNYLAKNNGQADANQLYIIWAGGNDFLHDFYHDISFNPPDTIYDHAINNLHQALDSLYNAGAQKLILINLPLLGDTPFGAKPIIQTKLNKVTDKFNQDLSDLVESLPYPVTLVDISSAQKALYDDPAKFGFTNVTQACEDATNCDANTWLFWDEIHPTDAGHRFAEQQIMRYLLVSNS